MARKMSLTQEDEKPIDLLLSCLRKQVDPEISVGVKPMVL